MKNQSKSFKFALIFLLKRGTIIASTERQVAMSEIFIGIGVVVGIAIIAVIVVASVVSSVIGGAVKDTIDDE